MEIKIIKGFLVNLKLEYEGLVRITYVEASVSISMLVPPHDRGITEDPVPWALLWGAVMFYCAGPLILCSLRLESCPLVVLALYILVSSL